MTLEVYWNHQYTGLVHLTLYILHHQPQFLQCQVVTLLSFIFLKVIERQQS